MDVLSPTLTRATKASIVRYQAFKIVITLFLLAYALVLTVMSFRSKDEKQQESIRFTREVWFGNQWGVIQLIVSLWMVFFLFQIGQPVLQYTIKKFRAS